MGKLTARMVASLTEKGRYHDGDNLILQVGPNGNKSWLFAYMFNGRARVMGLGSAKLVSLAEAREKVFALRRQVKLNRVDPLEARKAAVPGRPTPTFQAFAEEWISRQEPTWKNPKHRQQWRNTLTTYAYPVIGDLLVSSITTDHLTRLLNPIWLEKPETANRVRNRVAMILDAAKAAKLRTGDNPAAWRGNLKHLLPAQGKVRRTKHHGSVPYDQIPALVADLRKRDSMSASALEFTILCASRTAETTHATWDEIDFDKRQWTIPEGRTKQGREHIVPLSDRALEILKSLPRERDNPHVFPGSRWKRGLSDMSMLELLRGMRGHGVTVHGTARSGFRTWAAETGHPPDLAEAALGHVVGDKTVRAYNRGDLLQRRRVLMATWADYLAQPKGGKVVPMRRRKARAS